MTVRTRFAPSPTGDLHLGGLRTALYAFLLARHAGSEGSFYVRIEDTDRERLVEGSANRLLATLRGLGITWDDGPYVQSERLDRYRAAAAQLIEQGSAYRCDCTPERLAELREAQTNAKQPTRYDGCCRARTVDAARRHVIRFRMPAQGIVETTDILRGRVDVAAATLDDFVLVKSDGFPTYHLAHVVDDHEMDTTHVLRGDEWLPSLPKHILLFRAFGWEPPQFAHLPLLLNTKHKKLSKRDGDVSVAALLAWCLPDALLNFVALLGWNPSGDRERYTFPEIVAAFDLAKVHTSSAVVDFTKLEWLNGEYIRMRSPADLVPYVQRAAPDAATTDPAFVLRTIALEQPRIRRLDAFPPWYFAPYHAEAPLTWKRTTPEETRRRLELLATRLDAIDAAEWPTSQEDVPRLETAVKAWIAEQGLGVGETLWPMRVALSGKHASPSPFELAWCFGQTETLARIRHAIAHPS